MKKSHKKLEIVLIKEVENLGQKGDKISVAKGYARNFLIPQKFAILASTPEAEKILAERDIQIEKEKASLQKAKELATKIAGLTIVIEKRVGAKGKLFGSVRKKDILKEINKWSKIKLDKAEFVGKLPIKELGEHSLKIKIAPGAEAEFKVKVKKVASGKKD